MPKIRKTLEPIDLANGHRVIMRRPGTVLRVQIVKDLPALMGLVFDRKLGDDAAIPLAEVEAAIDFLAAHVTRVDDGPEDVYPIEGDEVRAYFEGVGVMAIIRTLGEMILRLNLADQGKTVAEFTREWEAREAAEKARLEAEKAAADASEEDASREASSPPDEEE